LLGESTLRALMIDHQDLFVLTPASAFRAGPHDIQKTTLGHALTRNLGHVMSKCCGGQ
jgi:hypothetical protein